MTETDFITLACPACGGKRTVKPGTISVKCEYCGNEYLVNPKISGGLLEMASQCPICHRNDRVEKVSSILANQIQQIEGTTLQNQAVVEHGKVHTRAMPTSYNATQATVLAQNLNHPPVEPWVPPVPSKSPLPFDVEAYISSGRRTRIVTISIAGILLIVGLILAFSSSDASNGIAIFILFLIFGLFVFIPGWLTSRYHLNIKKHPKRIKKFEDKQQAALDAYNKKVEEKEHILAQYQNECQNWNNLYYCYRDDCIFVPGKDHAAPVSELASYLDIA